MDQEQQMSAQENMETQMDGFDGDGFEAGLLGDAPEHRQDAEPTPHEDGDGGGENKVNLTAGQREDALGHQPGGGQQEKPEGEKPPDGAGETPPEEPPTAEEQPPAPVPLSVGGQQIMLPAEAVQALTGALGADPVELLQKGMSYDAKAERELRLLDEYARASGMTRQQYIEGLEQQQREAETAREAERLRQEFPGTPDEALRAIAESRMAAKREEQRQDAAKRQQTIDETRARINQTMAEARREQTVKAWDAYEKLADVHKPEDVPKRVLELVNSEGMTPAEAHWRYQAEQAEQKTRVADKQQQNRQAAPGSMAGAGADGKDDFLSGLFGDI